MLTICKVESLDLIEFPVTDRTAAGAGLGGRGVAVIKSSW